MSGLGYQVPIVPIRVPRPGAFPVCPDLRLCRSYGTGQIDSCLVESPWGGEDTVTRTTAFIFRGRSFSAEDLQLVREIVAGYPTLTRHELAATVAELLEWVRPNGGTKWREGLDLLEKLEADGVVGLPALQVTKPRGSHTRVPMTARGESGEALEGSVGDVTPVRLDRVCTEPDRLLWRELVGRYHYLGHTVPFGAHLRYLVRASRPVEAVVGCVQLSSPGWRVAVRDQWIGWDDATRGCHLQQVVNNSRFLIVPWVKVKNLASHVLAQVARLVVADWEGAYGVRPLLLETFVDRRRFRGTCYRAANWVWLGVTQGRGRMDRTCTRLGAAPKDVWVLPLVKTARRRLRGEE